MSAKGKTIMISEILADLKHFFRERHIRTNQFSPYLSSQIDYNSYKTVLRKILRVKNA